MAIQCNFVWRGITIPNAYIRIDFVSGGKRMNGVTPEQPTESVWQGDAGIYGNKDEKTPLFVTSVRTPWNGEQSPYPVLYEALKSQPEFSGAIDV